MLDIHVTIAEPMNYTPDVILGLAYQLVCADVDLRSAIAKVRKDLSDLEKNIDKAVKEEEVVLSEREQREKSVLGMIVMIDKAMTWSPCDCPVSICKAVECYLEGDFKLGDIMKVDEIEMKIIYPSNNSTYGKAPVRIQQNHLPL